MGNRNFVRLAKLTIVILLITLAGKSFALSFKGKVKKDTLFAKIYQNQADSLYGLKQFNQATYKYLTAAKLFEKHEVWNNTIHNYGRAGLMFLLRNINDSASYSLNTAYDLSTKYLNLNLRSNKIIKSEILDFLGHLYFAKREYDSALKYYNESLLLINDLSKAIQL